MLRDSSETKPARHSRPARPEQPADEGRFRAFEGSVLRHRDQARLCRVSKEHARVVESCSNFNVQLVRLSNIVGERRFFSLENEFQGLVVLKQVLDFEVKQGAVNFVFSVVRVTEEDFEHVEELEIDEGHVDR